MENKLNIRKFQDNDICLFEKWIYEDYVSKWYEEPLLWIDEIQNRHGKFSWVNHFIVVYEGMDIGFCQFYEYERGGEDWHGNTELKGTFSIDYLIGEKEYLRKGLGREIVKLMVNLILSRPNAKRIIVKPEQGNLASCNTLLSAGFIYDAENKLYLYVLG